jgi:hypothetical protein
MDKSEKNYFIGVDVIIKGTEFGQITDCDAMKR